MVTGIAIEYKCARMGRRRLTTPTSFIESIWLSALYRLTINAMERSVYLFCAASEWSVFGVSAHEICLMRPTIPDVRYLVARALQQSRAR